MYRNEVVNNENLVDFTMAQLYSLGSTAIGKSFNITKRLFPPEEIDLLENMHNEENLRDLEESFMMNASTIMSGNSGNRMK